MKEIVHPVWGSDRANQVSAEHLSRDPMVGLQRPDYFNPETDDERFAFRVFTHRCGLHHVAVILNAGEESSRIFVLFDGHPCADLEPSQVAFLIASSPDELAKSGGAPQAEFTFSGYGARHGDFSKVSHAHVTVWFKDKEQMNDYITYLPTHDKFGAAGRVPTEAARVA